jgi:hypothetical protein
MTLLKVSTSAAPEDEGGAADAPGFGVAALPAAADCRLGSAIFVDSSNPCYNSILHSLLHGLQLSSLVLRWILWINRKKHCEQALRIQRAKGK